jgi:hypothetical protein
MPSFDGTGPMGQGAQTGRRMGRCAPVNPSVVDTSFPANEEGSSDATSASPASAHVATPHWRPGRGMRMGQGAGRGPGRGTGRGQGRGRGGW